MEGSVEIIPMPLHRYGEDEVVEIRIIEHLVYKSSGTSIKKPMPLSL